LSGRTSKGRQKYSHFWLISLLTPSGMTLDPADVFEATAVAGAGEDTPTATLPVLECPGPCRRLGTVRGAAGGVGHKAEAPVRAPGEGLREVGRLSLGHCGSLTGAVPVTDFGLHITLRAVRYAVLRASRRGAADV
jgi:hypothetical protein